jgi:hypothetical protein
VGSHGSSSPAFAWGTDALISGEEIVSATWTRANLVPPKSRIKLCVARFKFFSFCDARPVEVSKSATFPRESQLLHLATQTPDATAQCSHPHSCISSAAPNELRPPRLARIRTSALSSASSIIRAAAAREYRRKTCAVFAPTHALAATSVESQTSVCYFLKARGVAQLGSAPALGAGGRPFKSARPDMRQ